MVAPAPSSPGRMAAVHDMARLQRVLFEVERDFIRTASTLIYRVGDPELKYLLCQHLWESAGHARFLRERGREMSGFGNGETTRGSIRQIYNEAVMPTDALIALAGFYRVLKPALLAAYRHYLAATHHLADWPSRKLVEEFIVDEERQAREMAPHLPLAAAPTWTAHLATALAAHGGWLGEQPAQPLPADFIWESSQRSYQHPPTCNRSPYPTCSSAFTTERRLLPP